MSTRAVCAALSIALSLGSCTPAAARIVKNGPSLDGVAEHAGAAAPRAAVSAVALPGDETVLPLGPFTASRGRIAKNGPSLDGASERDASGAPLSAVVLPGGEVVRLGVER
jgi:hypothetical protein